MKNAKFIGGPLNNTSAQMDIYVRIIPIVEDQIGRPISYYMCVDPPKGKLGKGMRLRYAFFIRGVMYASVNRLGQYVK